jgi:hypothetical protein
MGSFVKTATVPSRQTVQSKIFSFIDNSMPWDCISCRYQKHAIYQEKRIRYLVQELKSARKEICKFKAAKGSSNFIEQETLSTRCKPKNSRSRFCRFSAADASEVKLRNRFSVLQTDTLEAVQQNPGFLKQRS